MKQEDLFDKKKLFTRFGNRFDLVNHIIGYAKDLVESGRVADGICQDYDLASFILKSVAEGKDLEEDTAEGSIKS